MLAAIRALLSQDVLPTVLVFVVVVALLVRYPRAVGDSRREVNAVVPLARRVRRLASTIGGGFLVFVVLTAGISLLAGESSDYVEDSLVGGAVLAFAVVPAFFTLAIWLERSVPGRRRER